MAELTNFMIGTILVVGIFATLFVFSSHAFQQYNVVVPEQYNRTFLILSNMTPMEGLTKDLKTTALKENSSEIQGFWGNLADRLDLEGLFFVQAYKAARVLPKTLSVFASMVESVLDSGASMFGIATPSIRFIVLSLVVVVIIGAFLAVILKWWL